LQKQALDFGAPPYAADFEDISLKAGLNSNREQVAPMGELLHTPEAVSPLLMQHLERRMPGEDFGQNFDLEPRDALLPSLNLIDSDLVPVRRSLGLVSAADEVMYDDRHRRFDDTTAAEQQNRQRLSPTGGYDLKTKQGGLPPELLLSSGNPRLLQRTSLSPDSRCKAVAYAERHGLQEAADLFKVPVKLIKRWLLKSQSGAPRATNKTRKSDREAELLDRKLYEWLTTL